MGESFEQGDYNTEGESSSKPRWIRFGANVDPAVGKKNRTLSAERQGSWLGRANGVHHARGVARSGVEGEAPSPARTGLACPFGLFGFYAPCSQTVIAEPKIETHPKVFISPFIEASYGWYKKG